MEPKLRIIGIGCATYVELDGKTFGCCTDHVSYEKSGRNPASLDIHISDVDKFSFLPNGRMDEIIQETMRDKSTNKNTVHVTTSVDTSELDQTISKMEHLHKLIIEVQEISKDLHEKEINITAFLNG